MESPADIKIPGVFFPDEDSIFRNNFSVSKDPDSGVVSPVPAV